MAQYTLVRLCWPFVADCSFLYAMRHALLALILFPLTVLAQDTIRTEATDTFPICSPALSSSTPCATAPQVLVKPNPSYSDEARKAHQEGVVIVGLVVDSDGNPRDIQVLHPLGFGLDEEAIKTVKQWKFKPGTRQGHSVATQLKVEINFRLNATASPSQSTNELIRNLFSDTQAAYNRRDFQTAVNLARRLTELSPSNSSAWNWLGLSLLEVHELNIAASALETALRLDPASTYAYNNLGRVYWQQRKYDDAAAQFRKQIVLNPDDHYAHANLGMMLRDEKKCDSAIAELERALALTPNHTNVMSALGECEIDLGRTAKGLSDLEQATSEAASAHVWNAAAYILARHNIELIRAQKWAESAIAAESAQLHGVSLEHLSTSHWSRVTAIASYWDTLGWIFFQQGNQQDAAKYIEAAWALMNSPVIGYHLARIYETSGSIDPARTYAMSVVAAQSSSITPLDPDATESVDDAKRRLAKIMGSDKAASKRIEEARAELSMRSVVNIENVAKQSGSADFVLIVAQGKSPQVRQVSGNQSLATFSTVVTSVTPPFSFPANTDIEITRRGTVNCSDANSACRFVLLSAQDALDLARRENASDVAKLIQSSLPDQHTYDNPAIGIKVSLPDEWQLISEERGSFSRPHNAILGKPGTLAYFMLTRERMEGSADLYQKMLEGFFSHHEEYRRSGEMQVKRDGISGTRWNLTWKDNGVIYTIITEFFSIGDDHYRVTALAPTEVFSRYSENFEEMLRSVHFPLLHSDPKLLDDLAPTSN